jgi:heme exporter protein CcmD
MSEMFSMGDYGAYVWSSFGLTLIVLIVCVAQARRRHATVVDQIKMRARAMEHQE